MNILFDFRCKITAFSSYITYADFGTFYQFCGKCIFISSFGMPGVRRPLQFNFHSYFLWVHTHVLIEANR